ncbi:beta-1,3-glucan-binding protein 1-like [Condylostylus longicornis]|uniref:beta-1,3-glucan-binding protein 1-like n=1 Tax=Condylostylus longicornis TaxID=2530218 RepID=UPI00244D9F10|nr:beta-1,3-glucan-binding protein 1-like [Condylostylus longicornis]
MFKTIILIFFYHKLVYTLGYEIPNAKIEVFHPKGFQVSIPAEPGVTLFAFHGKLNEEMEGLEAGNWSKDITKAKNGRFTFIDRNTEIKIGDTIYFWTYALNNGLGYRQDNGEFIVKSYSNLDDSNKPSSINNQNTNNVKPISILTRKCQPSITIVNNNLVECEGDLIFEENFDSPILSSSKWTIENRFINEPDFLFVMYFKNSDALKIENGFAKIKPYRYFGNDEISLYTKAYNFGLECTGLIETDECVKSENDFTILQPLVSAQFNTKNKFNFKYGRIEIRARLPNADWIFPQIFLEPASYNFYGKNDYQSGQMRIAFTEGNNTCNLKGGLLLNSNEPFRSIKLCQKQCETTLWSNEFHIYSLNWQSDKITLSVDGNQYCLIEPQLGFHLLKIQNKELPNIEHLSKGTKIAPFDKQFYITLGYGVGGFADFPDNILNKPWRNGDVKAILNFWKTMIKRHEWLKDDASEFQIDYIRVFSI